MIAPNIRTLDVNDAVLAVRCAACGRRAVFTAPELSDVSRVGTMEPLGSVRQRLRCQCGAKEPECTAIPADEAETWLAGDHAAS